MIRANAVTNLKEVASMIGTFRGISEASGESDVVDRVLRDANERAQDRFNVDAGVRAAATRNLQRGFPHMYEFGVAGITALKNSRNGLQSAEVKFTNPADPKARLWTFGSQTYRFGVRTTLIFRNAVIPNPAPKQRGDLLRYTKSSGRQEAMEIINRMQDNHNRGRRYVFRRRAIMVETGSDVRISPINAEALVFPSRETDNPSGLSFWWPTRGIMSHRLSGESSVGQDRSTGAFTAFFNTWWEGTGREFVHRDVRENIEVKMREAEERRTRYTRLEPVQATNVKATSSKAKSEAKRTMRRGGTA